VPPPLVLEKGDAHYPPHRANAVAFLCPAGGECCRRLSETARAGESVYRKRNRAIPPQGG
jgi:hypothetical protein